MKGYWIVCVALIVTGLAAAGCNDYGNTFQGNTGAQLISLSPNNVPAGGGDFTLTVNGGGFVPQTVVEWNQQKLKTTATTDVNGNVTMLTAVVPASLIAQPGKASVFTQNPFSGTGNNGLSNIIVFIINNPPNKIPTITGVTSGAVTAQGLPITITGTNFLNSSTDATQVSTANFTLNAQQSNITPAVSAITGTQIQTIIPSALIAPPGGCASITVFNPASPPVPNLPGSVGSGGGTSNQWPLAIAPGVCPIAAVKKSFGSAISGTPGAAEETPAISKDGRIVAFSALQDGHSQIFVRDTCVGAATGCSPRTDLISVAADGSPADGDNHAPSMSADGRYVAFSSAATNLIANAQPGRQVYLRDTCAGADSSCQQSIQLISTDESGALGGAESLLPSVSASGRFVAFIAVTPSHATNTASRKDSSATSLNSGFRQVFVRDTCLGAANCTPKTTRISLVPGDGNGAPLAGPAISGDSRQLASPGAAMATFFTHSVAVDDQVFLAATKPRQER